MITTRTEPDESGRSWKLVEGWWCPCTGPDAGMGHHASECVRRVRIQEWVATYPAWRPPRAKWLDACMLVTDDEPVRLPLVRCRLAHPEEIPPAAKRLDLLARAAGRKVRITYAKGWGRRKVVIGYEPEEQGGAEIKGFRPWPVESVVLRVSGTCSAVWERQEGETSWAARDGYAVWAGRIWPANVTAITKLLRSLERGT